MSHTEDEIANKSNLLKGMKIRDEFLCPITYELMREPVVAMDGHTYEKHAIEKWLKSNHTSPRSGEAMEATIIPNINLKKLIQDIINEGGAGFYTNDISNRDRLVEVCPEKVLILECLGPPESDWNMQSFQVNKYGCIGGRKHSVEDSYSTREMVLFKDITVSRRHFEITHMLDPNGKGKSYYIRDLGSAGGTYIRILFGTRKELHPGMIVLLGKHQFIVSSIDDSGASNSKPSNRNNSEAIVSLAEQIINDISRENQHGGTEGKQQKDELSARLKSLTMELSQFTEIHRSSSILQDDEQENFLNLDSKVAFQNRFLNGTVTNGLLQGEAVADSKSSYPEGPLELKMDKYGGTKESADEEICEHHRSNFALRRCTLTCCGPDGSPLQGKSFIVGPDGATMGRKNTNAISLYIKIITPGGEEKIVTVDTAISAEHARVEFEDKTGRFFICDGTPAKPSTNGTWFRLSGPHQESPPHQLLAGNEVLIGNIRFQVREAMTISERKVNDEK